MRLHRRSFGFAGIVDGQHVIIRRGRMSKRDQQQARADGFKPPVSLWTLSINGHRTGAPSWSLREVRVEAVEWLSLLRQDHKAA